MKLTLPARKPRNPLVTLARSRKAGRHGHGSAALRQSGKRDLQRELDCMKPPH